MDQSTIDSDESQTELTSRLAVPTEPNLVTGVQLTPITQRRVVRATPRLGGPRDVRLGFAMPVTSTPSPAPIHRPFHNQHGNYDVQAYINALQNGMTLEEELRLEVPEIFGDDSNLFHATEIERLEEETIELVRKIDDLMDQREDAWKESHQLRKDFMDYKALVVEHQQKLENENAQLKGKIEDLRSQLETCEAENKSLSARVRDLDKDRKKGRRSSLSDLQDKDDETVNQLHFNLKEHLAKLSKLPPKVTKPTTVPKPFSFMVREASKKKVQSSEGKK